MVSSSFRRAPLSLAAIVATACLTSALAQQRDVLPRPPAAPANVAPATISGRVTSAADGRAIRGAVVSLTGGPSRATLTDAEGRFVLPNLRAGSVVLNVSKTGFLTQRSGQRHPLQPGRAFQVAAGGRYSADFALVRGSAIAGTIVDHLGDPVAGALVELRRSRMVRGRRLVSAVLATDMTDDTGAFRLHSVPEGDYYVTARFLSMISALSGATTLANLPIGSAVYYPGTPSMADAQRIPLGSGEDRGGIVFPLVATTSVRISGTLVDAAGAGVDGGSVELHDAADFSVVARSYGNFGETFDGGRFTMINVTPGSYVLVGTVTRPSGPETAYQPVTVGTSDMSGITLAAARGVTISGSVAAASGAPLPASIMITARSMSGAAPASDSVERGAFTLNGIVGPYALGVEGLAAGWAVQSFDINGIDVADGVINFPPSGQLTAQIVLTNRLTELTGTVRSEQGPVADADVVIFPENPAKWPYPSRLVRVARGDAAGRYRVTGLPPARYLAIALDYLDEDEYQDPDVLARLRGRATSFALGEAAKASVDLMMVRR